jgi:hypothetical protein
VTNARANLRTVKPGEKPPAKRTRARKLTVSQAATKGTQRDLLVAMRDRLAIAVSDLTTSPRDLAALTRRLQDIAKEIEAIDLRAKEEGEDADEAAPDEAWDEEAL